MPVDIVEMLWGCECKAENLGRFKTCQTCGRPRAENSPEWMPGDTSHEAAVTDTPLLTKFKGGADWMCVHCDSSQFRADGSCAQCGGPQDLVEGVKKSFAELFTPSFKAEYYPSYTRAKEKDKVEKPELPFVEGAGYRDQAVRVAAVEKDPFPSAVSLPLENDYELQNELKRLRGPSLLSRLANPKIWGVLTGISILVFLGWFLFHTKEVDAEVASVTWIRTVDVERYAIWPHEGWYPDTSAVSVRDEGRRIHHYDTILIGSHQEPHSESYTCGQSCTAPSCYTTSRNCTSNKNGSATCSGGDRICSSPSCSPQYCSRTVYKTVNDYQQVPRYQNYYSWGVWEWAHVRSVSDGGHDFDTHWPSEQKLALNVGLSNGEQERTAQRLETYTVKFDDHTNIYNYLAVNDEDFHHFTLHSRHHLKVGMVHGVEVIR